MLSSMEPNGNGKPDNAEVFRQGKAIDEALAKAFRDAMIQHRRNGVPMVFWQDCKVVEIPADQVPID